MVGGTALFWLNRFGHIEQAYGFSPVWVRSCADKSMARGMCRVKRCVKGGIVSVEIQAQVKNTSRLSRMVRATALSSRLLIRETDGVAETSSILLRSSCIASVRYLQPQLRHNAAGSAPINTAHQHGTSSGAI